MAGASLMDDQDAIAALSATQVVALTLYGEARGQSSDLRAAIASVIGNRAALHDLTPREVCLQHMQFSCWNPDGSANHLTVMATARNLLRKAQIGPILLECLMIAADVCVVAHQDTVNGATHYFSPRSMVPLGHVPGWAIGKTPVATVDGTLFFRLA